MMVALILVRSLTSVTVIPASLRASASAPPIPTRHLRLVPADLSAHRAQLVMKVLYRQYAAG
jgi:hypothetical protein